MYYIFLVMKNVNKILSGKDFVYKCNVSLYDSHTLCVQNCHCKIYRNAKLIVVHGVKADLLCSVRLKDTLQCILQMV